MRLRRLLTNNLFYAASPRQINKVNKGVTVGGYTKGVIYIGGYILAPYITA